jgi:hypothetical protein
MAIDHWTGVARGAGASADVNGIHRGHGLAIIPGETHDRVFMSPVLVAAATSFLDRPAD